MSEIAESLGVTKPAIYQYFSCKEDLYAAVAEHGRRNWQQFWNDPLITGISGPGAISCSIPSLDIHPVQ